MDFQLLRATETDLPFIMATERGEGYDAFVGRWDEARHREALFPDVVAQGESSDRPCICHHRVRDAGNS